MDVQLIKRSLVIKRYCERQVKLLTGLVENFSTVKVSLQPAAILLLPLEYLLPTHHLGLIILKTNHPSLGICRRLFLFSCLLLQNILTRQRLWSAKFKTIQDYPHFFQKNIFFLLDARLSYRWKPRQKRRNQVFPINFFFWHCKCIETTVQWEHKKNKPLIFLSPQTRFTPLSKSC